MESSTNSRDSVSSTSSDQECSMEEDMIILIMALYLNVNTHNCFHCIKLSCENQFFLNPTVPINDVLMRLIGNPSQLKKLIDFLVHKFVELCGLVVPTIETHA